MATSSIIENIRVNNPKVLEEYVEAMENSAKNYKPRTEDQKSGVVTDPERTKALVEKIMSSKGMKV